MPSSFDGAEGSVDAQRKSALDALAQFGRRGLEAAVVAQKEGNRVQTAAESANAQTGAQFGVGAGGQKELAALSAPAKFAYNDNGRRAAGFMASENQAAQAVNGNFFGQLRQAVPLARTEADQLVDQYRAHYAEQQAQAAAQAELQRQALIQAALEQQQTKQAMEQAAALYELEKQGLVPPGTAKLKPYNQSLSSLPTTYNPYG